MTDPRGFVLGWLVCALSVFGASAAEMSGQPYPTRPMRLIVPYPAGGNPDAVARVLSLELERRMGQPIVIDNRGGASGVIGINVAANAAPNGYTMLFVTSSVAVNQAIRDNPPYDIGRDFAPVTAIAQGAGFLLVVHPSVPAQTLTEFITLARAPQQRIAYGSSGSANVSHLMGEMFNIAAKSRLMHVPYKGSGPALNALLGGEVQAMFVTPTIGVAPIRSGKLRALGFSGAARWNGMPEVPAIAEVLPGFRMDAGWMGWLAPARTPPAIVQRLNGEISRALKESKVRDFLIASGYQPTGNTPEAFRKFMREELVRFREIARVTNIKAE